VRPIPPGLPRRLTPRNDGFGRLWRSAIVVAAVFILSDVFGIVVSIQLIDCL
jgi:hypothetical protein